MTAYKNIYTEIEEPLIDGDFKDWVKESFLSNDSDEQKVNPKIDILSVSTISSHDSFYLKLYFAETPETTLLILIDTDNNLTNGYNGADIAIEDGIIYRNKGFGWNWSKTDHVAQLGLGESSIEYRFYKEDIGVPTSQNNLRAYIQSTNYSKPLGGVDFYPKHGISNIKFSNSTIAVAGTSNYVTSDYISIDGYDYDWGDLEPLSHDPDDIESNLQGYKLTGFLQPWLMMTI